MEIVSSSTSETAAGLLEGGISNPGVAGGWSESRELGGTGLLPPGAGMSCRGLEGEGSACELADLKTEETTCLPSSGFSCKEEHP